MERRWLLFFILSFLVIQMFTIVMHKNQPPRKATVGRTATQTTETLAREGATSATAGAETAQGATSTALAQSTPAPRMIENTSITVTRHPGELTTATTSKYQVAMDSVGAVVNSWRLLDPGSQSFRRSLETSAGIEMVERIPQVAGAPPQQTWPLEINFSEQNAYNYEDFNSIPWQEKSNAEQGKDGKLLEYTSPAIRGLRVTKALSMPKNDYYSTLRITVHNDNDSTVSIFDQANNGLTLRWGPGLVERSQVENARAEAAYDDAVLRSPDGVRAFFPKPEKEPLEYEGAIQWAGVESKFFTALMVPNQPDDASKRERYAFRTLIPNSHVLQKKDYTPPLVAELATDRFDIPAKGSKTFEFGLYLGPKKYAMLKAHGHDMQTLMFHNAWPFMRVIYLFLTDLLNWIFAVVRNYGVAIILLTVIVRLATFPLTQHSIRIQAKSMAEMARIKPYLEEINEKYKDKPEEKNRQTWKVYQEHGVSPFGAMRGCIPMLLQLPIFYGLYRVSSDTIDLKGAHFLWISDLSQPDHILHFGLSLPIIGNYLNLLPILMGLTQMLAARVAQARVPTQDPTQKQMMYFMPIFLMVVLYSMPAGLMLYWIASNIWQVGQTMLTNRQLANEEAQKLQQGQAVPFTPKPKAERQKKK